VTESGWKIEVEAFEGKALMQKTFIFGTNQQKNIKK